MTIETQDNNKNIKCCESFTMVSLLIRVAHAQTSCGKRVKLHEKLRQNNKATSKVTLNKPKTRNIRPCYDSHIYVKVHSSTQGVLLPLRVADPGFPTRVGGAPVYYFLWEKGASPTPPWIHQWLLQFTH